METMPKVIIPENYATDNALITNTQLSQTILALGANLAPIIKGSNEVFPAKLNNSLITIIKQSLKKNVLLLYYLIFI
jgi:hypothetical protein